MINFGNDRNVYFTLALNGANVNGLTDATIHVFVSTDGSDFAAGTGILLASGGTGSVYTYELHLDELGNHHIIRLIPEDGEFNVKDVEFDRVNMPALVNAGAINALQTHTILGTNTPIDNCIAMILTILIGKTTSELLPAGEGVDTITFKSLDESLNMVTTVVDANSRRVTVTTDLG